MIMIGACMSKSGRQLENPAFLFFKARIKLFELNIIVSFETKVDTGVGDKIELEGY